MTTRTDIEPEGRGRRLRRAADRVGRLRPHRGADGQAGHRAEGARGRARAGRRGVQGPRRQLVSGVVKRVDRNGIYVDLGGNAEGFIPRETMMPARAGAPPGPHQGLPAGRPLRAARPAAVPDPHRARVPDRAVQDRGAGGGPGPHRTSSAPPATRALRAKIAVRSNDRRIDPGRRLRRHARLARAGRVERDRRRARRHHPLGREPGAVRDQRDVAGRGQLHRR